MLPTDRVQFVTRINFLLLCLNIFFIRNTSLLRKNRKIQISKRRGKKPSNHLTFCCNLLMLPAALLWEGNTVSVFHRDIPRVWLKIANPGRLVE